MLHLGDCLEVMAGMPAGSVDAVVTDPPYPEIDRPYGRLTEAEWFALMKPLVGEVRRVLKPTGSAVFILQPNSEKVGRMRTWLWEFMAWVGKEWGIVQDVWWWNFAALPMTNNRPGLLRPSVKACVWCGPGDCFRDDSRVLWEESQQNRAMREAGRCTNRLQHRAGRATVRDKRARSACVERGGVTPFNLLPVGPDGKDGKHKHPGKTPLALAEWWVRYITPPGGVVLDPFTGSGTVGLAALAHGCDFIGIEKMPEYVAIARNRLARPLPLGAAS